jgi:hypothetical protein
MVLTSLVETSSPDLVAKDSLKKYFNKKVPYGVATCLELATLEIVEISISTIDAMSLRIIGLRFFSSP